MILSEEERRAIRKTKRRAQYLNNLAHNKRASARYQAYKLLHPEKLKTSKKKSRLKLVTYQQSLKIKKSTPVP
jgi:uncharacterized membrane protein